MFGSAEGSGSHVRIGRNGFSFSPDCFADAFGPIIGASAKGKRMSSAFPEITLVRHGETEWSASGKHTGRTDIPLTPAGEEAARKLAGRLQGLSFQAVWSSPSQRAFDTSRLAGFGAASLKKDDLAEWDYGAYEGLTTKQILAERPGWSVFRDGCPQGEGPADVGVRADRIIAELRAISGSVLIFSSAHFLRVLAARWVGVPPQGGAYLVLDTASVSVLGYEHDLAEPVIRKWNQRYP
jgi:probable phosphoglycerate mutase